MPVLVGGKPPKRTTPKWILILVAMFVPILLIVIFAPRENSSPTALPIVVDLQLSTVVDGATLTVNGTTNLPEGILITLSACRYHLDESDGLRRCIGTVRGNGSTQKVPVMDGAVQAVFTLPSQAEVTEGLAKFAVDFQMPGVENSPVEPFISVGATVTPRVQPAEMLYLMGENGELLQGSQSIDSGRGFRVVSVDIEVPM